MQLSTAESLQIEGTVGVLKAKVRNVKANESMDPTVPLIGNNGEGVLGSVIWLISTPLRW